MLSLVKIESSPAASTLSSSNSALNRDSHTSAHTTATSPLASKMQEPTRPARAVARIYPAVPDTVTEHDDSSILQRKATTEAFDAGDLERSRPVTPVEAEDGDEALQRPGHSRHNSDSSGGSGLGTDDEDGGVEVLQSMRFPRKNMYRMATVALITLNDGLNDSAAGALIPYIERHYNIGYGIVALIFVACAFGSIFAATIVDPMKRRWGYARTLLIGQILMAAGYVPMLTMRAPFAAVVVGFFVVGLGEAMNVAMGNTFCAGLRQGTAALGIMHGSYGIGGISGPLIATAIVVASGASSNPDNKSASVFGTYYFLPFAVCVFTAVLSSWSFTGYEKDWGDIMGTSSPSPPSTTSPLSLTDPAERRRRWRIGRQKQEENQRASPELTGQTVLPSWDRKEPGIQLTEFNDTPLQRPQPVSQPSTAAPSRAPSPTPTSPMSFPQRPILSPLQSPMQSAFPTPAPSFMSTSPLVAGQAPTPVATPAASLSQAPHSQAWTSRPQTQRQTSTTAVPTTAAAAASIRPVRRSRTQRAKARLHDMFTAPSSRVIFLGAMFLFMYQGSEVSIAGWVTSFLIADRGGQEPAVGYITAGFWAGITLGRFGLAVPAQRIGPRRFVYGCVIGAGIFELLVWFVPNVIGDAVAVSIVGLLLGPVYPCAAGLLMRGLSRRERVAGVSAMAAFGSAGGAAAPFITGVLAQAVGTFVLHPIAIALFVVMLIFWYLVPAPKKSTE